MVQRVVDVPQPQLVSWQRHAPGWQLQEQGPQLQVPQQVLAVLLSDF